MVTFRIAVFLLLVLLAGGSPGPGQPGTLAGSLPSVGPFLVFDAIGYKNKPDLRPYGLHPLNLIYANRLVSRDPSDPSAVLPDDSKISQAASQCLAQPAVPVTLDIESWSYKKDSITGTVSRFVQVLRTFKAANPASPVGYYGVVPNNRFAWKNIQPEGSPKFLAWQQLNVWLDPVARQVDLLFPACYTFDNDTAAWRNFVTATIGEARKYLPGKRVYAYLWPQYHEGTPTQLQFVDLAVWKFELETIYTLADGCVIWSSAKGPDKSIINWDSNMPWWRVLRQFIRNHAIR
jgi:hypothetical protein